MKLREIGMLVLLASVWGASFLFIRIASPAIGPLLLVDLRVLVAGIALVLYAVATGRRPQVLRRWRQFLLLGAVNAAVPFCLISAAELELDASLAAILNAMTPLFTALVAYLWIKDPFSRRKLAGVLLGVAGVVVLVGWSPSHTATGRAGFALLSLAAAFFYGIGGVYSSKSFKGEAPLTMAIGQQLAAGLLLLPVTLFFLPKRAPSAEVVLSVLGLALLSTSLAYLLYFRLITRVGPVRTLSVTFLVPVFGIVWAHLFLHEPITISALLGLAIILLSVALVTNVPIRVRRRREATAFSRGYRHRSRSPRRYP